MTSPDQNSADRLARVTREVPAEPGLERLFERFSTPEKVEREIAAGRAREVPAEPGFNTPEARHRMQRDLEAWAGRWPAAAAELGELARQAPRFIPYRTLAELLLDLGDQE